MSKGWGKKKKKKKGNRTPLLIVLKRQFSPTWKESRATSFWAETKEAKMLSCLFTLAQTYFSTMGGIVDKKPNSERNNRETKERVHMLSQEGC